MKSSMLEKERDEVAVCVVMVFVVVSFLEKRSFREVTVGEELAAVVC